MGWFSGMRVVVYLKRISEALERIAAFTDAQMPAVPKRSKRVASPVGEIYKPTISDFNERWREENPDEFEKVRDEY